MIKSRDDLSNYLQADALRYPKVNTFWKRLRNTLVTNPVSTQASIFCYVLNLRYAEYHHNNSFYVEEKGISALYHTIMTFWYFHKLRKLAYKTGIQVPPNTVGPGLAIFHFGSIVVNPYAKIGARVKLHPGVTVGRKEELCDTPVIGDDVTICTGAKIIGPITVGNNVVIAPNAVVVKNVPDNAVVAGVPAKVIKYQNLMMEKVYIDKI